MVLVGDVLVVAADALNCPANPWLNLSGGIGGEILRRGGDSIQAELHAHLVSSCSAALPAGSVVATGPGSLPFKFIIHAVAIDPFYDSSAALVAKTLIAAFGLAVSNGATSLSVPAVATGFGHLRFEDFADAAAIVVSNEWRPLEMIQFVIKSAENARILDRVLTPPTDAGPQ